MKDYSFQLVRSDDEGYDEVVDFSLSVYDAPPLHPVRQAFPNYVCVSRHGAIAAVCGFRSGARGLFLEQFMEEAADSYIEQQLGVRPRRAELVELGAVRLKSAALIPLFAARVAALLAGEGFRCALALAPGPAGSVEDWMKARTTMSASDGPRGRDQSRPAQLRVCALPLGA